MEETRKTLENEMDEFVMELRKSVITNVLAVLMATDKSEIFDMIEKQDVEKVFNMIYGKEDDDGE